MNSRHFITTRYGGIKNALAHRSQLAVVIHAIDQRIGKDRACGKRKKRNPFRGIAHSNGSSYNQRYFRHVEGARDTRSAWPKRNRDLALAKILADHPISDEPFRDINPVPAGFCE